MANPNQVRNNKGMFAKTEDGEIVPNENPRAVAEPPFASVVELQRSYITHFTKVLRQSDMALRKDRRLQREMRRDPDVMAPLFQRQSAVALLEWQILAEDEDDPSQVEQAETLENLIKSNLQKPFEFFMALLDATWYGPAAVQLTPELRDGFVVPGEWMPIHSDTLAFTEYGDLTMYVGLKYEGEKKTGPYGMIHTLDEDERKLVVLHTHGRQGVDYEVAEEAAFVYAGRGMRDVVWYYWMMKQTALQFWMTWIERYGMGIRIGTYPDGNSAAKDVMEEVLQNLVGDVSVVIPRQPGEAKDTYSIEVQEPNAGQAKTFADLIEGYLAGQIKELIIGQTATTEATATGLGSSVGDQHAETFRRIIQSDALNLADTLTREFVWRYHDMNFGDTPYKPRLQFSLEKNDPREFMEAVRGFVELGGNVSQRQARDVLGLTEPEEGEPVLASQQEMEGMGEEGQEENPLAALLGGRGQPGEAFKKYQYALKAHNEKIEESK
jgi:phage gp29-like protein